MLFQTTLNERRYRFASLRQLMAKATPRRSGDELSGVGATDETERVAAQMVLADLPLKHFLQETVIPYEDDDVTRLIQDNHDMEAFCSVSSMTVGQLREFLLAYETDSVTLREISRGLTPEMVAAVAKIMRNQDLILAARKCEVVTRFRNTIGQRGRFSVRLQPNHPTDDPRGILAAIIDGLMFGCGDAVIGINPAGDNPALIDDLLRLLDKLIQGWEIPTQGCILTHVSTQIAAIERGVPVDLVFQSIGGTEATNHSFGINLTMLKEANEAARSLQRGTVGHQVMYFETGQGSSLSAGAHHDVDQQTLEARAYGVARFFDPFLVNSVVGFIGPEYLADGRQITRAGLEDHFCGKILGLPMGCDVCYTNHVDADQDDMDSLLTLLAIAGCSYVMGVPGADDIMLNYQSTSFHDAEYVRQLLNLRPAPEFEGWLRKMEIFRSDGRLTDGKARWLEQKGLMALGI